MTKKIITGYGTFLCMAVVMASVTTVQASEVTGTLSSDTSQTIPTTGEINGTVTGGDSGGSNSSGGTRSSGGGGNGSSNSPSGSVLGATTDNNTQTPGFPNAGTITEGDAAHMTLWSSVMIFFRNIFSL